MQHLVMFVVDSGESKEGLERLAKEYTYETWGNGGEWVSSPTVVELTEPEYTEAEQDYIGDQIAEMQEEIAEAKKDD